MIRRYGAPRVAGRDYRRRVGVHAVVLRGGCVLLTRQAEGRSAFQLPGGGVGHGEARLLALHREVGEQTGWRIAPGPRLGAFRRFAFMAECDLWAEKLCVRYLARPVRRLGAAAEPGHSAHRVAAARAPGLLDNDGDRMFPGAVLSRQARGGRS